MPGIFVKTEKPEALNTPGFSEGFGKAVNGFSLKQSTDYGRMPESS